ncbi:MAG: glycosyltransferase family 4 protein [Cyclobacteriaceae bacterium]|nr:glycosyltransferase family 4 protein [Cyclobacteriaceae bacterium]
METLVPRLREYVEVSAFSEKRNQLLRFLDMLSGLIRHRKDCELVLIDVFSSRAFWYAYTIAKLSRQFGIPYILVVRGGDFETRLSRSRKFCDNLFRQANVSVAPSAFLQKLLSNYDYRVDCIPNFIEIEKYPFLKRNRCAPKLLWVRAFHKVYNPTLVVEIAIQLLNEYKSVEICMVGAEKDGSMEVVKEKARKAGIFESIRFTGFLAKNDWIKISAEYDIFINTTNFDNTPVSVIEAMALGLPVISTNVGGLSYLIMNGETGFLVKKNDALGFVEVVKKLIEDEGLAEQVSINGRNKAQSFDWRVVGPQWKLLIDSNKRLLQKYQS